MNTATGAAAESLERTGDVGSRPLNVCHLAYTFYENDNRVIRYAEALAARGDSVDVIALRRPGQATAGFGGGVRIYRIQRRAVSERRAAAYFVKILWFLMKSSVLLTILYLRRRYEIIHIHNVPDFLVFAAIVPRLMGARIVLDIHDILPELYSGKFGSSQTSAVFRSLLFVERLSCRFADHVIVANDLWHEKLVRRAVAAHKCTSVLNYPDLCRFKPLPQERRREDSRFVILYPGTLNHHQGVDLAISAFDLVKDQMPAAELHIYGEGPARSELAAMVRARDLGERVKLMDRVPLEEIAEVMASADVGVVPKRADGFGNEAFSTKILEFMACGVPVIVSRTKVDAYYFDETLVQFFESGQVPDLARALLLVYSTRREHTGWIQRARDFAALNSWQKRAVDYTNLIDSLLPAAPRTREIQA